MFVRGLHARVSYVPERVRACVCPSSTSHICYQHTNTCDGTLVIINALAVVTELARNPAGATAIGAAGGIEAIVDLLRADPANPTLLLPCWGALMELITNGGSRSSTRDTRTFNMKRFGSAGAAALLKEVTRLILAEVSRTADSLPRRQACNRCPE